MCIAALVISTGHDCVSCCLLCPSCHLFIPIFLLPLSFLCDVMCDIGALFKEDAVLQGWAENWELNSCKTEQFSLQPAWAHGGAERSFLKSVTYFPGLTLGFRGLCDKRARHTLLDPTAQAWAFKKKSKKWNGFFASPYSWEELHVELLTDVPVWRGNPLCPWKGSLSHLLWWKMNNAEAVPPALSPAVTLPGMVRGPRESFLLDRDFSVS